MQSLQQDPQQPPFCTDVHRSYQYDRAHNVVRIEDDRWKQTTYRYNANDQITETQYSNQIGNRDEKFLYDANLNLTEHMTLPSDAQGAMLQLFQQQQAGRVTRRDTARGYQLYHYDVNGRLEKKIVYEHGYRPKEWRYLWSTQNQLTACFTPKGDCWRYTYDAFGRRLSKTQTVDSQAAYVNPLFPQLKPKVTAWHYLWSGDQLVEETPIYADGTIAYNSQVQWLYEPGAITPTARYQNGKLHYVVTDHQGTPREIFTEAGKASWAGRLNTWGQMQFWQSRDGLADNDPNYTECHFRFAGQYEDSESGLYYNRFRYYDRDSGQYISPDPIGLLGGFNPYGYVHCPTGFVDPFGLAGDCCDKLKWGNPKSKPTYGHTFIDHGQKLKPQQLMDRARAKNHQIGQYLDDNAAANFISDVAKKGPGVHDVPLPNNISGRGYLPNGVEIKPDMARVVVKPDGSIRTSFPYSSSHPN
ncbi:RHS repeat domain-containing protein [Providencia hangzhouensis]|uniref:RHS repeat domain-containing protein n=1 Tax=Providencia TaxID=586 RepID=UPI001FABD609|nr:MULTISPECIES: RHS repeat-associated core domain-containing protein [Providencia]WOB93911.1 RHS repeat-associated core domain-containing protein [Providencia sp. PROV099]